MIKVSDFKGIDNLEIPFDGKSTVIFGVNGVGKSTILRAIDLIYANFISKLVSSKKKLAQLEYDDISYGKTSAKIDVVFEFSDGELREYSRSISRSEGMGLQN